MKRRERSYPHPVLGNGDDVPGAAFQTSIAMSTDNQMLYIDVDATCSCRSMNEMIRERKAAFVAHVECGTTFYRKAYTFFENSAQIAIPSDALADVVEVNTFIRAVETITAYNIPEIHPDYQDAVFKIEKGDILGIGDGYTFSLDNNYDALSNVGSIMQINESDRNDGAPMEADFWQDKIVIYLSKRDFKDYRLLRQHKELADTLTTTIVLPVLMEAIKQIKSAPDLKESCRWATVLERRIERLKLNLDDQELILAQKLLEAPVRRTLAAAKMLAESIS